MLFSLGVQAAGPGTSSAAFLKLGFGARALGMGESFVAMADDVSGIHYNPAGLAYPASFSSPGYRPYEVFMSQSFHIQDIRLTQMAFARRPFGISMTYLTLGDIEARTSETAAPDGSFGASDMCLGLSYGRKFGGLGLGVTGKYIRETIGTYSATAYAADLGALYRFSRPFSIGVGLANIGTGLKFVEESSPLPLVLRTGVTYGLSKSFPHALSIGMDFARDSDPVLRLGFEYAAFGPFNLRAGYRTFSSVQRGAVLGKALGSTGSGLSEFYGMFMGAGFNSKLGSLDYAIMPYGELGNAHRFSASLRFGGTHGR